MIFGKKQLVEIRTWASPVGLRDAPRVVGSDGTVSIFKSVCLSPRVEKPKSQEGNKGFNQQTLEHSREKKRSQITIYKIRAHRSFNQTSTFPKKNPKYKNQRFRPSHPSPFTIPGFYY